MNRRKKVRKEGREGGREGGQTDRHGIFRDLKSCMGASVVYQKCGALNVGRYQRDGGFVE